MADLERGKVRGATIIGENGQVYQTPLCPAGYSPIEGDSVMLLVQSGTVLILDTVAVMGTAAPAGGLVTYGDPTPPAATTSGTLSTAAVDSGSWRSVDGWGRPSSRPLSPHAVAQYTYTGSGPYSGAWFYGSQAAQLSGATIGAVRLRISSRLRIGSYNSALTAHLYLHSASGRPSGDVTRVLGPSDETLAGNFPGGWVALPLTWAPTLIGGGGVGIYGSPYLGINGIDVDPASGQLAFDWAR